MTTKAIFQHRFDNIEDYIHHRAPYLLVNEIVQIDEKQIHTRHTVSEESFFAKGHFPGAPIMPGAMMQELSTQSAGVLICLLYTSPSPRDLSTSRMPSSA